LDNYSFSENEYLIAKNEAGEIVDKFVYRGDELSRIPYCSFKNSYTGVLKPRNEHQEIAFEMLNSNEITVKLITGTWGTGKTLALVVAALDAVQRGRYDKIVWVRNNVQVKDTDNIGALPGDSYDKVLPYLGPMLDHIGGEDGAKMLLD
jgi:PhoH-like ATPase